MTANSPHRIASTGQRKALFLAPRAACLPARFPARFLARFLACSAVGASLILSAPAQPVHTNGVPRAQRHEYRHEIEQLEDAWRTAILKGNSAALENLLADDYTGITAKGAIQTKDQAVQNLKTGALQLTSLEISDRKIRVYGATAVVTSVAELTGSKSDQAMTGRYRYTRVYVRNPQGQWKIVSFEASRIQESPEHK